jgi:hypothetical protein
MQMRLRALCRLRLAFLGGQGEDSGLMATTVIHVRDMREGDVYIGHRNNRYGLPESIWANPHYKDDCSQEEKVERFEAYLKKRPDLLAQLHPLKGKRLACWCKPKACHGDVLARLADAS